MGTVSEDRQAVDHVLAPLDENRREAAGPGGEVGNLGERGTAGDRGVEPEEPERVWSGADDRDVGGH